MSTHILTGTDSDGRKWTLCNGHHPRPAHTKTIGIAWVDRYDEVTCFRCRAIRGLTRALPIDRSIIGQAPDILPAEGETLEEFRARVKASGD